MTDTPKIEPALTAEHWAAIQDFRRQADAEGIPSNGLMIWTRDGVSELIPTKLLPTLIAEANNALPATDPRRFTREHVAELLYAANEFRVKALLHENKTYEWSVATDTAESLEGLAAALASYLPPE